jgi:hydroxymethylbilane synthase
LTPQSVTDVIRLGTRASVLARTQSATVGEALSAVAAIPWLEVLVRTSGDDTSKPLNQPGSPGLFVSTLRHALLAGEVDVIVHSFKDLPSAPEPGIVIAAIPLREDPRDALVSQGDVTLSDLRNGAIIGTSSPRRAAALVALRPDLEIRPIRGNVDSRIRKVREGEFDAVVLAMAGITRMGRQDEVAQVFDFSELLPAPAQGALAVECRAADIRMITLLGQLDDAHARLTTAAEREVLVGINAACTTAIGASADYVDGVLTVRAELANDGDIVHATSEMSERIELSDVSGARVLGLRVAAQLLGAGDGLPVLLIRSEGNENDAASLARHGVGVVSDPYVQIVPATDGEAARLLEALLRVSAAPSDGADDAAVDDVAAQPIWVVATSPMTVPSWIAAVGEDELRAAVAHAVSQGVRAAATGERTAASLRDLGFDEVLVPDVASAQGLVDLLAPLGAAHALFPRGNLALRTLPDGLTAQGWQVQEGIVYVTSEAPSAPASVELIRRGGVAAIVLRSPSAVRALLSFITPPDGMPIICAGQTTARAARDLGLVVTSVAPSPSSADVAATVASVLQR